MVLGVGHPGGGTGRRGATYTFGTPPAAPAPIVAVYSRCEKRVFEARGEDGRLYRPSSACSRSEVERSEVVDDERKGAAPGKRRLRLSE